MHMAKCKEIRQIEKCITVQSVLILKDKAMQCQDNYENLQRRPYGRHGKNSSALQEQNMTFDIVPPFLN